MDSLKIQVPATTANLGPGFDTFGCALNMYNTFTFNLDADGLEITGCPKQFQNEDNLVYQGFQAVMDELDKKVDNLSIHIESNIPIARGLGSSSSLLVAGAFAANEFFGKSFNKEDLLNITNDIEGHPDNLTPAIYGGLTASFVEDGTAYVGRFPIDKNWLFTALVPDFPLETTVARMVLPDTIDRQDAIYNVSHGALLLKALEVGSEEFLLTCMKDKMHQKYRRDLIYDYDAIESFAASHKIPLCISGAGPTLLCVTKDSSKIDILKSDLNKICEKNWKVFDLAPDVNGVKIMYND